jgi:hypothetical protein
MDFFGRCCNCLGGISAAVSTVPFPLTIMKNGSKPELNGKGNYPLYGRDFVQPYFERLQSPQPHLIRWTTIGWIVLLLAGGAIAVTFISPADLRNLWQTDGHVASKSEAFRLGVNRAMSAAELTQTAQSQEEWLMVVTWWQDAIRLMQSVPETSDEYAIAQGKVLEYGKNLEYAQRRLTETTTTSFIQANVWHVGSLKDDVLRVQGEPQYTTQQDLLCQEVLHYGHSRVELTNGFVSDYVDADYNLKVAVQPESMADESLTVWSLGSHRATVFAIQGVPDRVITYDTTHTEVVYYGNSSVMLTNGYVVGYSNFDSNLRVIMSDVGASDGRTTWTLNSPQADVFAVQGTPTRIVLDRFQCQQTLYYGHSTIEVQRGVVTAYDNVDQNLRVGSPSS